MKFKYRNEPLPILHFNLMKYLQARQPICLKNISDFKNESQSVFMNNTWCKTVNVYIETSI